MANSVDGTININEKAPITGQYHESKLGKKKQDVSVAVTEAKLQENNIHLVSKVKATILSDFHLK